MLWGFVPELFSQTNGSREGDPDKRCIEGRTRGKEPLEKAVRSGAATSTAPTTSGAPRRRRGQARRGHARHKDNATRSGLAVLSLPRQTGVRLGRVLSLPGFSAGRFIASDKRRKRRRRGGEPAHRGADEGKKPTQGEPEGKRRGSTEWVCTTPFQYVASGWCSVRVVRAAREAGAQQARRRAAPEERILCCSSPTLRDQRATSLFHKQ